MIFALIGLSLALVAAVAAFIVQRKRRDEPLQALAQSVAHLSRSDMRAPIWGVERKDSVGELARAIDLARYHFSQLPDVSLMSEQGPVRIRFEGETRSLFEAMMRNISQEYERTRTEATGFIRAVTAQEELLSTLTGRLNGVMTELQKHGATSHEALQKLVRNLTDSAQSLSQAHDKNIVQMNRLLPFMQERAQNMAEVTHIAGTQVTQTLQAILSTEQALRSNATESQQVIQNLAATTNQLGERLFAAVNLMQASGKALSESTEAARSRFTEAVETLSQGEGQLKQAILRVDESLEQTARAETSLGELAQRAEGNLSRMETSAQSMAERHEQLSEQVLVATHRMESIVASFESAQRTFSEGMQKVQLDGELLRGLLGDLKVNNEQLVNGITQNSQMSYGTVQALAEKGQALMQQLENQMAAQARTAETQFVIMASKALETAEKAQAASASLAQTVASMDDERERLSIARQRFVDTVQQFGGKIEDQAVSTLRKAEEWAGQSFGKLAALSTDMEGVIQRLNILGQLTGMLGGVAGQLGQLVPALTEKADESDAVDRASRLSESMLTSLQEQLQQHWHEAMVQIEAMHDQLAQTVVQQRDQLETRLVVMDKKLKSAMEQLAVAQSTLTQNTPEDSGSGGVDPQQAAFLNEIVSAIAKISEHVTQLDAVVRERE